MAVRTTTLGGTDWTAEILTVADLNDTVERLGAIVNTIFGTGNDGAVTISGNTTLTTDKEYTTLTVNSGINLTVRTGSVVRSTSTTTLTGNIVIGTGQAGGTNTGGGGGGGSGGDGGTGGGSAWLFFNTLAGAGNISANGGAATNGSAGGAPSSDASGGNGNAGSNGIFTAITGAVVSNATNKEEGFMSVNHGRCK